jgi:flagellar biosynthesis protein FlhA
MSANARPAIAAPAAPAPGAAPRSNNRDVFLAVGMVVILAVMILPLPRFILDLGLSLSICISLITFLVAIYLRDPLDLSVFPSLILVATLLRLSLNVASTRLVLLHGSEGTDAAGKVIQAFGQFVVGGNYAVGIILFLILVVINFVVITKGAGRVAEVAARFTLDAMPGKQMAIDADLGAGLITEKEARRRRTRIQDEASFHGAMDGASKFVRGDAVAGLVITAINVVGGIAIGILQHGMSAADAAATFTILSVGDGLVAQIPALLMSTAAGIVVTKAIAEEDLGSTLLTQVLAHRRPSAIAAAFLFALALVPGMPHLTFLILGGAAAAAAAMTPPARTGKEEAEPAEGRPASEKESMESLLPIELLELEIGYEMVSLVDNTRTGNLLTRIAGIRRQFATDLGIIVPPVHVRDNLQLRPGEYRVLLSGNEIGRGEVRAGQFLAMDPGTAAGPIDGLPTKEPAFGLPARWIVAGSRSTAETLGYTVVDAATVVATHISELLRKNAAELVGRREVQELLDIFAKTNPRLVEDLVPNLLPLGEVIKVLRNLLRENISIRDLRTILEALCDHAAQIKDPDTLTELVRQRMAKHLTARVLGDDGKVHALILEPQLEQDLKHVFRAAHGEAATIDGLAIPRLLSALERTAARLGTAAHLPVLVVAPEIRPHLAAFAARHVPGLAVYSYREIEPNTPLHTLGVVGGAE